MFDVVSLYLEIIRSLSEEASLLLAVILFKKNYRFKSWPVRILFNIIKRVCSMHIFQISQLREEYTYVLSKENHNIKLPTGTFDTNKCRFSEIVMYCYIVMVTNCDKEFYKRDALIV